MVSATEASSASIWQDGSKTKTVLFANYNRRVHTRNSIKPNEAKYYECRLENDSTR